MKKFSVKRIAALLSAVLLFLTVVAIPMPAKAQTDKVLTFSYVNPLYADVVSVQPRLLSAATVAQTPTYHALEGAGAVLRDGMEARTQTVTVGYVVDGINHSDTQIQQYAKDIFNEATKHTGVPTQGDYLLWHYSQYSGSISRYIQAGKTYITYTYELEYLSTAQQEQIMDEAVDNLLEELDVDTATDYEKVCAIYDYLCENITYATTELAQGKKIVYTAYAALINKRAVCQGYASLFYRLALSLGVDTRLIAGSAAGGRHGWNIVELAGAYYNLDATWDAGMSEYSYFLKCEANFGDHTRFNEYNTAAFHAAHPMSPFDYIPDGGMVDDIQSGETGDCRWTLNGTVLTISGFGAMGNYQHFSELPWGADITEVHIKNGVTTIGDNAFARCFSLASVKIPETVVSIGAHAFENCTALMAIELPAYVDSIDNYAFFNCVALTDVWFCGSEWQAQGIRLGTGNDALQRAVWHYKKNEPQNRWMKLADKWYYFENGTMVKNAWRKDSKGWVYLGENGAMVTDKWVTDSKGWCYVGADGYAVTNCWKKDSHGWIYLDANGSMTKSKWVLTSGKWYYCDANGYMISNKWMKDSKGWVYLGENGAMVTNKWVRDSVGWCYVGADGYAVTNCWKKDSVGWCYLNANGNMTISAWVKDGGNWYYLDANGYMVANKALTISGKKYNFNASGVCTNP